MAGDRVTRFGVNFPGYSGAYAGVLKLSAHAAAAVRGHARPPRPARLQRGAHVLLLRHARADRGPRHSCSRRSISPAIAGRKSTTSTDIAIARARVDAAGPRPMGGSGRRPRHRGGARGHDGAAWSSMPAAFRSHHHEFAAAIRSILDGRVAEFARDRNSICYRVRLSTREGAAPTAIVKVPRPGPQRTNADATFAMGSRDARRASRGGHRRCADPAGAHCRRRQPLPVHDGGAGQASGSADTSARSPGSCRRFSTASASWIAWASCTMTSRPRTSCSTTTVRGSSISSSPGFTTTAAPMRRRPRLLRGLQRLVQPVLPGAVQRREFRVPGAASLPRRARRDTIRG